MEMIDAILELNALHEVETSPLTHDKLTKMMDNAFHWAGVNSGQDGYIITFDQDADYDSANFLWFKSRYDRFVYVDRIVVADNARGKGLAKSLYKDLFELARTEGHTYVACEINTDPPNPGSFAFHESMGFAEVGHVKISADKAVSYQLFSL
jgi:uncharacterized protein